MSIETMKLALEALEINNKAWKSLADSGDAGFWEAEEQPFYEMNVKSITALRQAIEQAQSEANEQSEVEPVKVPHKHEWFRTGEMKIGQMRCISCGIWGQEESPPQRQWVGLTDDEREKHRDDWHSNIHDKEFKAIEAKLKQNNGFSEENT